MSLLASIRSCLFAGIGCCSLVAVASAATWPLACQARAGQDLSGHATFQALAGNGVGAYTFAWDFGDGSTSTEQNPSHTYTDGGIYRAVLTVTDANVPSETCRDTALAFVGVAH